MSNKPYRWAARGDINAFFGLMLDNVADLLLAVGLLAMVFGFPADFALQHMVPGTAIGVMVGDLLFFWIAIRLARRTGRDDVTAMPLGLDTPSTFGMVFFVLGPAFLAAKGDGLTEVEAARQTWHIGIWAIVMSGLFKFACAAGANWVRKMVPRAGLLGSLTAIALVLITFMPFVEVLRHPVVGFVSMAVILTTLVAKVKLPFKVPGALGAMLIAGLIFYLMKFFEVLGPTETLAIEPADALMPTGWFSVFQFGWTSEFVAALNYMPIVIPFALGTVIGGIDCTESAASAGDEYDTRQIIGVEAFATLIAGLCGGVIQSTPYIGHPAYKSMGGRSAYTLATALFVGGAGLFGYFGYLYEYVPKATIFPILIFVGLEITAQSFAATTKRHYAAIAIACIPALAALLIIYIDRTVGSITSGTMDASFQTEINAIRALANGFVLTSMLWAAALAFLIDRRLRMAACFFMVGASCSLVGIIHSPLPGSPLMLPGAAALQEAGVADYPIRFSCAYLAVALLLFAWSLFSNGEGVRASDPSDDDHGA